MSDYPRLLTIMSRTFALMKEEKPHQAKQDLMRIGEDIEPREILERPNELAPTDQKQIADLLDQRFGVSSKTSTNSSELLTTGDPHQDQIISESLAKYRGKL